jgi:predicted DNA-binding ribbon-helix-helix protein
MTEVLNRPPISAVRDKFASSHALRQRTVTLQDGRKAQVRLETAFWEALDFLAERQGTTTEDLVRTVAEDAHRSSLASVLRMHAIDGLRRQT